MATFTNQASLTYGTNVAHSNVTVGEIQQVLTVNKNAVPERYEYGGTITYVVNLINAGDIDYTGLVLTDNLGKYTAEGMDYVPLTYVPRSVQMHVNGVKTETPPAVETRSPLKMTGITVPANSNAAILYKVTVNSYAPLGAGVSITNTVVVSGGGLSNELTAEKSITHDPAAILDIKKDLEPKVIIENGEVTYTFTIRNFGRTAIAEADNSKITDTFDPVLSELTAVFNGTAWADTTDYTYNTETGKFESVAGKITVPAATYAQNPTTGEWTVEPGVRILTIKGKI